MNLEEKVIKNLKSKFNHTDNFFFWGSCFSEHISEKLKERKLNVYSNSHGVIFNPLSILSAIDNCVENKVFDTIELNKRADVFFHYDFHGEFESLEKEDAIEGMNQSVLSFNSGLQQSKKTNVFITFGSAWVYKKEEKVVANCHKIPPSELKKELLTVKEIKETVLKIEKSLSRILEEFQIIYSISPVRHKKDGWVENNQSKSALILGVHEALLSTDHSMYFPSYEWVIDLLRDYSFYEKDGVHPNSAAVDFVWSKVEELLFDDGSRTFMGKWIKLNRSLNHRVQLERSLEHKRFLKELLKQIEELALEYPFLQLNAEELNVKQSLKKYFGE